MELPISTCFEKRYCIFQCMSFTSSPWHCFVVSPTVKHIVDMHERTTFQTQLFCFNFCENLRDFFFCFHGKQVYRIISVPSCSSYYDRVTLHVVAYSFAKCFAMHQTLHEFFRRKFSLLNLN